MEYKTDALLLRAVDYGENDKMITLLTADRGKIGAGVKGVKKASAKLKFAAQPFCFAEYVFALRSGRYTVTSAALHDGFYSLREDVCAFYAATVVCEACDALVYEGMESGALLITAVTALKELSQGGGALPLIRFLLSAMQAAGYPVLAETCPHCGGEVKGKLNFDFASGSFFCGKCNIGTPASESTYHTIRTAQGKEQDSSPDGERRALKLLRAYFNYQTDGDIPALGEYLSLIK